MLVVPLKTREDEKVFRLEKWSSRTLISNSLNMYTGSLVELVHGFMYILKAVYENIGRHFGKPAVQRMAGRLAA
ncbi:hypothetical protein HOLleu_44538 [Holothuria leucospilota]|uniref:Uncharacterized protein n=1 Tax=Holothuria leucospilota TaxID=206669 RepID=A0A9Q0Y8S3_HOLLE|nr:hypothetical protein HOLleu_44538 [Holothuria leucospilota]